MQPQSPNFDYHPVHARPVAGPIMLILSIAFAAASLIMLAFAATSYPIIIIADSDLGQHAFQQVRFFLCLFLVCAILAVIFGVLAKALCHSRNQEIHA